ncbi:MAG: hypothetical protein CSA50_09555 [Gammaproteobacteria bacterium]|nr:MAG: hypothetical protein CSA50_09555 [Gammaproteobacteria bacterium]
MLHNLSFVEDPTRVFRAIRFEQRFGFTIGKLTGGLIDNAVRMNFFKRLSGKRVFTELKLLLAEENPPAAFRRLDDFKLLQAIHPSICYNNELAKIFASIREVLVWYTLLFMGDIHKKWVVYFLALFRYLNNPESVREICNRLELTPQDQRIFQKERIQADRCLKYLERHIPVKNSLLAGQLSPFKIELVLYLMAVTSKKKIKQHISHYLTHLRHIQINLTGKDLKRMKIPPGPIYRQIFEAVLGAKLDGEITSPQEEIELARQLGKQGSL